MHSPLGLRCGPAPPSPRCTGQLPGGACHWTGHALYKRPGGPRPQPSPPIRVHRRLGHRRLYLRPQAPTKQCDTFSQSPPAGHTAQRHQPTVPLGSAADTPKISVVSPDRCSARPVPGPGQGGASHTQDTGRADGRLLGGHKRGCPSSRPPASDSNRASHARGHAGTSGSHSTTADPRPPRRTTGGRCQASRTPTPALHTGHVRGPDPQNRGASPVPYHTPHPLCSGALRM